MKKLLNKKILKKGNAREWLLDKYGKKEREEMKVLNIHEQNLKGSLEFDESWEKLEEINCSLNQLTSLDVSKVPNLKKLYCHYNQLTDLKLNFIDPASKDNWFDFSSPTKKGCEKLTKLSCAHNLITSIGFLRELPNKKALTHLDISDNSIHHSKGFSRVPEGLNFLCGFTNLKYLYLDNWDEKLNTYNYFSGSLEPLKDLKSLKKLGISNTDIDLGLEHLPDDLHIICETDKWPASKVGNIKNRLVGFESIKEWKKVQTPAQVWLDSNYPESKRGKKIKLDISGKRLEGKLKLKGFTNLEELNCSYNQLTSLDIEDCRSLQNVYCNKNKLSSLKFIFDEEDDDKKLELEVLNCYDNQLTSLDLVNCPKLKDLFCGSNQINSLKLVDEKISQLETLNCSNNCLGDLTPLLPLLSGENLKKLFINDNKFTVNSDLSFFEKFTNLEILWIGNDDQQKQQYFSGSLRHLQVMKGLKNLHISNTSVSIDGVDSLPSSLKVVFYSYHETSKRDGRVVNYLKKNQITVVEEEVPTIINAQTWLDANYPEEEREQIKRLKLDLNLLQEKEKSFILTNEHLGRSLVLKNFRNLQFFSCADNNLQTLNINNSNALISLDCSNNIDLKKLICINSRLTNLNLDKCDSLTVLALSDNGLTDVNFLTNLPSLYERLKELYIANNNFVPQNLTFLSKFINLSKLDLANNRFYGSLEPLKDMDKLEMLDIKETNIDSGWKHLPKNLLFFYHSLEEKNKVIETIKEKLEILQAQIETSN